MATFQDVIRCFDLINCEGLDNTRWSIDTYSHDFNVRDYYGPEACNIVLASGYYLRVYVPLDEINGSLSAIVRMSDILWVEGDNLVTFMRVASYLNE